MNTKKKSPQNRSANHATSFYFDDEDRSFLEYGAEKSGLKQSELLRRLIRAYVGGYHIPGITDIAPEPKAQKWLAAVDVEVIEKS